MGPATSSHNYHSASQPPSYLSFENKYAHSKETKQDKQKSDTFAEIRGDVFPVNFFHKIHLLVLLGQFSQTQAE